VLLSPLSRPLTGSASLDRVRNARGFTLIELLIIVAIVAIVSALAMAGYRMARVRAGEGAAISALQAINQAQLAFSQTCGNQRYAPTLVSLGVPVPATGEAFLSPDLTVSDPVLKSGYQITMTGTPATSDVQTCNGVTPVESYQVTADPIQPGLSGINYFGTNSSKAVFADVATFTGNMPETGAPGHGAELR
jgi:prepilin-type N-terminal cleavage/methylation domain-containing protein